MKPPRPKVHLFDCQDPLLNRFDILVRCGLVLAEAEVQISYGVFRPADLMREYEGKLSLCTHCLKTMPKIQTAELTYLYLLSEKYKFQFEEEAS
jgi:hypothetical protein